MMDFVLFLQRRVFAPHDIADHLVAAAFRVTVNDIQYHFPDLTASAIQQRIEGGESELAVFLFRLGQQLARESGHPSAVQIHWLLRDLCSCEFYFNNDIDIGFYVVHGEGTVIGSRNRIGRGFTVHHGCTIGHRSNGAGLGSRIGNDVTMYCNSSILGELEIGDQVVIGAHVLVTQDLPSRTVVTANRC